MKTNIEVISKKIDSDDILLDISSGDYFSVNPVGADLWSLLKSGHSQLELISFLSKEYGLSPEHATKDVKDFVQDLEKFGLVEFGTD